MLALAVLFFAALYLLASLLVVVVVIRWARRRGRRAWLWGGLAALAMYNLVFWDLLPTFVRYKYYCAHDAGFWIYTSPADWIANNPGLEDSLRQFRRSRIEEVNGWTIYQFNSRLRLEIKQFQVAHAIGRTERVIRDTSSGKILAREIHFFLGWGSAPAVSGGGLESIRRAYVFSWLKDGDRRCGFEVAPEEEFRNVERTFRSIGR